MDDNLEIFKIQISYLPLDKLKNIHTILSNKNINFESLKSMDIPLKVDMNSDNMLNEINNEINKREDMLKNLNLDKISRDRLYNIIETLLSIPIDTKVKFKELKSIDLHINNVMNNDEVSKVFFIDILNKVQKEAEKKEKQMTNNEKKSMSVSNNHPLTQMMMVKVRNFYGRVKNVAKDPKGAIGLWTLEMKEKYKIVKQKLRENIQHRLYMLEKERHEDLMKNERLNGGKYKTSKKSRKLHHRLKRQRFCTRRRHMHRLR